MKPTNPSPKAKNNSSPQSKKPLIIALISLGAIILLSLLIFFGQQFVGKAITVAPNPAAVITANKAGIPIVQETSQVTPGERITLPVYINPSEDSLLFSFSLSYPTSLGEAGIRPARDIPGLTILKEEFNDAQRTLTCVGALLPKPDLPPAQITKLNGLKHVVDFIFEIKDDAAPGSATIDITDFQVLKQNGDNMIISANIVDATFEIVARCTPSAEICDGADNDCDDVVDNGATCEAGQTCLEGSCQGVRCTYDEDCPNQICFNHACRALPCTIDSDCGTVAEIADLPRHCVGSFCQKPEIMCEDDSDNDGDNLIDCDDPDCVGLVIESPEYTSPCEEEEEGQDCTPIGDVDTYEDGAKVLNPNDVLALQYVLAILNLKAADTCGTPGQSTCDDFADDGYFVCKNGLVYSEASVC